jgi:hypothetical protein
VQIGLESPTSRSRELKQFSHVQCICHMKGSGQLHYSCSASAHDSGNSWTVAYSETTRVLVALHNRAGMAYSSFHTMFMG